jgi:hypothetical protein
VGPFGPLSSDSQNACTDAATRRVRAIGLDLRAEGRKPLATEKNEIESRALDHGSLLSRGSQCLSKAGPALT